MKFQKVPKVKRQLRWTVSLNKVLLVNTGRPGKEPSCPNCGEEMSAAHQCKLPSFQAITETNPDAVKPEKHNVTPAQPRRLNIMKFCDLCDSLYQSGSKCTSCFPPIGYLFCPFFDGPLYFSLLYPSMTRCQINIIISI